MGRTERQLPNNLGLDGPKRPDRPHIAGVASHRRNLDAANHQLSEIIVDHSPMVEKKAPFITQHTGLAKEGTVFFPDEAPVYKHGNPPGVTDRFNRPTHGVA